ncbi:ndufa2, NADH:ubiquinone oxidoreductase 10.5kD subunit [Coemansia interrupta]|uniref:Ndufa2, NADH:ubiquinone oxidoreductase 10.5kD subunit n=1 Tax=Coemansia interrupta TaxID=1126814 RepID=A0A9W8HL49_9FUNG|nr:ndufa2, NADH:ubiquinone oxidoreductase 10.5kD subunit [Coemansia interrupta]
MAARGFSTTVSKGLRELRVHMSQGSVSSKGLRDFIGQAYPGLKQAHPGLPILIREASGVDAQIIARFERGRERKIVVDDMTAGDVEQRFRALVAGDK